MKYILVILFLFSLGAASATVPQLKDIPEAPKLTDLNFDNLPKYLRDLLAPKDHKHVSEKNSKNVIKNELKLPNTYGMSLVNDRGFVWNDLNNPETIYEVGENVDKENGGDQTLQDTHVPSNDINKELDDTHTNEETNKEESTENEEDKFKDSSSSKYEEPTTNNPISDELTTIDNNTSDEGNINVTTESTTEVAQTVASDDTEKLTNNIHITSKFPSIQDLDNHNNLEVAYPAQDVKSQTNSTSDVPTIPIPELQSIFDNIITNYSNSADPHTTTKDDLIATSNWFNSDLTENEIIVETTPNAFDFISNTILVDDKHTTETIVTTDSFETSTFNITDKNSDVQDLDAGKENNIELPEDGHNLEEKEFYDDVHHQVIGINFTDVIEQIINDVKFQELVNDSIKSFLEPLIKQIGAEIKDEVTSQLEKYLQAVKSENNSTNSITYCHNELDNTTQMPVQELIEKGNDTEVEESTEIKDILGAEEISMTTEVNPSISVQSEEPESLIHTNESFTDKTNEPNNESNVTDNTDTGNIYVCEACKIIFNLNFNVTKTKHTEDDHSNGTQIKNDTAKLAIPIDKMIVSGNKMIKSGLGITVYGKIDIR